MKYLSNALPGALGVLLLFAIFLNACSKGGGGNTPPTNACSNTIISITGTVTDAAAGSSTGSINVSATGGSGALSFSLNGGSFQASGTFSNLAKGNYTITAKDANGCTGSKAFSIAESTACNGVTITLTATTTGSDPCAPGGSLTAVAGGSTNFTYSLGGAFQANASFSNLSAGNYTLTAKDGNGCTQSIAITISALSAGSQFAAARAVIQNNCALAGCHSGASPTGGLNFTEDCTIVQNKDRIKARAIDGNPSIMPPTGALPQGDKDKLTAWLNAGGRFVD